MRPRRILPPLLVLTIVGVTVGALWASTDRPDDAGRAAELAAIREAGPKATRPVAGEPALCHALRRTKVGTVADADLDELSGLVLSRRTKGVFWAIEDSGAQPVLTALRSDGSLVGNWTVPGAANVDWEDVATGPGGTDGPYLYAADIGDNGHKRDSISAYRVREPASPTGGGQTQPAERLELHYPDGAHDAESLLIDPVRGTLIVITKDWTGHLYALSRPQPWGGTATLKLTTPSMLAFATAADISSDGTVVALRGYGSLQLWKRRGHEPLTTTMKRRPCTSPTEFDDGQGEAIALSPSGTTAWSVAEGVHPPIYRYQAK